MEKIIIIEGMHCQHCVKAVEEALSAVAGVSRVSVSLEHKSAVVDGNDISDLALREAVEETGFDVLSVK